MTALVTTRERVSSLRATLEKMGPELTKALSGAITPEKMLRLVMTDVQANPQLLQCDPQSIMRCVMEAAQLNLATGAGLGQAYLVPFKGKCQLIIGYKGLLALVHRSGVVSSLNAQVVRVGDDFSYRLGTSPEIRHVRADYQTLPLPAMTHVYAIAALRSGGQQFEVMQRQEVEAVRYRARVGDKGPWQTDYDAMALKTCLRRLCRVLPQSSELQVALSEAERMEAVTPFTVDASVEPMEVVSGEGAAEIGAGEPEQSAQDGGGAGL